MRRLEVISKFFLALASSMVIFLSGFAIPPLGVILLPFVVQPVLIFGVKYGIAGGLGVLCFALLLLIFFAGEAMAFIYAIFALMAGLLFGLLGRLRVIEQLVVGVSATLLAVTASVLLYFFGSWSAMLQEFRQSISQQMELAVRMHEKMGFPADGLKALKERAPYMIEMMLQLLPVLGVSQPRVHGVDQHHVSLSALPRASVSVAFADKFARVERPRAVGLGVDRVRICAVYSRLGSGARGGAQSSVDHRCVLFCPRIIGDRLFFS